MVQLEKPNPSLVHLSAGLSGPVTALLLAWQQREHTHTHMCVNMGRWLKHHALLTALSMAMACQEGRLLTSHAVHPQRGNMSRRGSAVPPHGSCNEGGKEGEEAAEVIRRERQMEISIYGSGMHRKALRISISPKSRRDIVISVTSGIPT